MFARQSWGGCRPRPDPPAPAVPAPAPGTSHRHRHVPEATPPGDTGPGPTPELQHPQLGEGLLVPHVAPLHTVTVTTPCPSALPAPAGTTPGAGDSWEGPGRQRPQDRPRPATTRASGRTPGGSPSHPRAAARHPAPAAPQNPSPAQEDTPSAPGHGCWGDWEPGGCLGGRGGGTVHTRGTPHPAARPGQDQAPAHRSVHVPAHAVKMLSWR